MPWHTGSVCTHLDDHLNGCNGSCTGDFEAATYLLGTLECMPALSCLSLVGMTLRMGLDLRHLCSLTHLALGARSLCLAHAEPARLPRSLRSVHAVSADVPHATTLSRLRAEAGLDLKRVCREGRMVSEAKLGDPHEYDVDFDNLDDLNGPDTPVPT